MTLAAPIWLAAAASIAVPILIHLFGRPRPRLRRFPSLMLLRRVQTERRSAARLRRIVALILRCIALVLLAIMLARPVSEWPPLAGLGERLGSTAIILDTSPGMGAMSLTEQHGHDREPADAAAVTQSDGRSIDRARDAASKLIDALPPGEKIALLTGGGAVVVTPEEAARAVAGATVGDRRARLGNDVAAVLEADEPPARVFLLTDGRATSLEASPATGASQARVIVVDVGIDVSGNSALIELETGGEVHLRGRSIDLTTTARLWGEGRGRVPLTVECDGEEVTVGIDLLADSAATATVEIQPANAGVLTCTATLPFDAMRADDTRAFATVVRERLRVGVVGGGERSRFIEAALDPFAADDPRSSIELVHEDVALGVDLDAVIVPAGTLADGDVAALRDAAEGGTGTMLFANADQTLRDALGFAGVIGGDPIRPDRPAALAELATARAPLAGFAEPGAGDLSEARFTTLPKLQITDDAGVEVLARYDDGTPALLEGTVGRGRTLLLMMSPDDAWTDLVRMPEFVPLMHRMVRHLAGGRATTVLVGPPGEATVGEIPGGVSPRVVNAEGQMMPVESGAGHWRFIAESRGAYRLQFADEDIDAFAVNLDSAASDPRRLSAEEMRERLRPLDAEVVDEEGLSRMLEQMGPGPADISSLIALLALLVIAVESVQSLRPGGSADDE